MTDQASYPADWPAWKRGCWLLSRRGHHLWDQKGCCIMCGGKRKAPIK